jgi:hypothetical protein
MLHHLIDGLAHLRGRVASGPAPPVTVLDVLKPAGRS